MTPTEKAIRDFCGHHADWWPSISQVKKIQSIAQLEPFKPDWDTQAVLVEDAIQRMTKELKESSEKVKKLEKIIADQESMLERQTARIVDLQTHIENFEGEE